MFQHVLRAVLLRAAISNALVNLLACQGHPTNLRLAPLPTQILPKPLLHVHRAAHTGTGSLCRSTITPRLFENNGELQPDRWGISLAKKKRAPEPLLMHCPLKGDCQARGGHAWQSSGREYHQMLVFARGGRATSRFPVGISEIRRLSISYG